ncbi:hypothetical protein COBT_000193 [Conglomerata obtusa]
MHCETNFYLLTLQLIVTHSKKLENNEVICGSEISNDNGSIYSNVYFNTNTQFNSTYSLREDEISGKEILYTKKPAQKSPIASLKIPSNTPLLNIIKDGASQIFLEIKDLYQQLLIQVSDIIEGDMDIIVKKVTDVINDGNIIIFTHISRSLTKAFDDFAKILEKITKKENYIATRNIKDSNNNLYQKILRLLKRMEKEVSVLVQKGSSENMKKVIEALTAANNDVLKQIQTLLDDEKNTKPIINQIRLADPVAITNLIVLENNEIYNNILQLFTVTLLRIQKAIIENSENCVGIQEMTLNKANNEILKRLSNEINEALKHINKVIRKVNEDETKKIIKIFAEHPPNYIKTVEKLISQTQPKILEIVKSSTNNQVKSTKCIIKKNNNEMLKAVKKVLS